MGFDHGVNEERAWILTGMLAACGAPAAQRGADPDGGLRSNQGTEPVDFGRREGAGVDQGPSDLGPEGWFPPVMQLVGPEGGRLQTEDPRVYLLVPPGALTTPRELSLDFVAGPASRVGTVLAIGPKGTRFDPPARLSLVYDEARFPGGTTTDDLQGAVLLDGAWVKAVATRRQGERAEVEVTRAATLGLSVRTGQPTLLRPSSELPELLPKRVLDEEAPDYVVEASEPATGFNDGIFVRRRLRIEPGVKIGFEQDAALYVEGLLTVRGSEIAPVVMEGFGTKPGPGHWDGLILGSRSDTEGSHQVENLVVRHAGRPYGNPSFGEASVSASISFVSSVRPTTLRQVSIEDGFGRGIDMVENVRGGAARVSLEDISVRRVPGLAIALWPAAMRNLGAPMLFESVGRPKIWVRSGEVVSERIRSLGVPILIGMTDEEVDRYVGFSPVRRLQVGGALSIDAGARVEFRPNGGILLLDSGSNADGSSIVAEGTSEEPVVFAAEEPGTLWGGIDVRSSNRSSRLLWSELEDSGPAIQIGFEASNGYIRLEDTVIRRCSCAVSQLGESAQVEFVNLRLEETDDVFCR